MKELKLVANIFIGAGAGEFGGLEFAGGEIDVGEAYGRAGRMFGDGGQEIIFAGVENGDVGGGAGGDDADNFATNKFLAGAGLLHLIADGDFEAGADAAGDVAVSGVVRNAAHGDGLAFFAIAGGQGDLQL